MWRTQMGELLATQQAKIETHPCYSKQAHQYARIHLPVAPACNIQCNYCNRKFDCSNESRPGVVSKLMSPAEAVARYQKVKMRIPETRVVGIAGPGDPLANPKSTIATLKAVAALQHELHLCVSTNGLNLLDHVDDLKAVGVDHLTITINCIDADIGSKIYPWVYFNHKRLRGRVAAQTLIDRQLAGLKAAADLGMLVKINTVLIPGINDHHVAAVAQEVKRLGAMLHNVMPLIAEAEHGTYFGLMGQRSPTESEIAAAREAAGQSMEQMSHCQQCRADAVGKLGQDCHADLDDDGSSACGTSALPAAERYIAVASQSGVLIDQHFGHATHFQVYQLTQAGIVRQPDRDVDQYCLGSTECDDESLNQQQRMSTLISSLEGCDQVLCSRIGMGPWQSLEQHGVAPSTDYAMQAIDEVLAIEWQRFCENSTQGTVSSEIGEVC
ncbi:nitrogenase cofactor biosynthesis protein NifB [Corallincola luteus]|uniref:FeMo cofactor biosynthesis protein NifB n=2 Tax=Corallincola luteus TaxID=1775177 RepID=A0ABY2AIX7_9GAMM|nr:nitrogenase cofactor biosynthesis protein NifB [Corallincola luteus]